MGKLIKLNKSGTLGISIPKSIVSATGLNAGDVVEIKIEQTNPEVIIKFRRPQKKDTW
jgi:bifunctional DNA-binding transcriptional regulator/antitoxin component of YhaV-PrlF toxin-antitoxin module